MKFTHPELDMREAKAERRLWNDRTVFCCTPPHLFCNKDRSPTDPMGRLMQPLPQPARKSFGNLKCSLGLSGAAKRLLTAVSAGKLSRFKLGHWFMQPFVNAMLY